jgi:hypothetical protein
MAARRQAKIGADARGASEPAGIANHADEGDGGEYTYTRHTHQSTHHGILTGHDHDEAIEGGDLTADAAPGGEQRLQDRLQAGNRRRPLADPRLEGLSGSLADNQGLRMPRI